MLDPSRPASDIQSELYQYMVRCTVLRIMGHVTVRIDDAPVSCATGLGQTFADYAWGIYKESTYDVNQLLAPFTQGYNNEWMHHAVSTLWLPSVYPCSPLQTYGSGGETFRRHILDLRKYRRTLDPSNDSLVFVVENSVASGSNIYVSAYFRMLVME